MPETKGKITKIEAVQLAMALLTMLPSLISDWEDETDDGSSRAIQILNFCEKSAPKVFALARQVVAASESP